MKGEIARKLRAEAENRTIGHPARSYTSTNRSGTLRLSIKST